MKKQLIIALSILFIGGCGKTETTASQSEIYLVRHFQKQAVTPQSTKDVELTQEGHANALSLADHLESKDITIIYSTDYRRTNQTAAPISELISIPISLYEPENLDAFALQLLGTKKNQLVVGHSNTTGVLFGLLGCEAIALTENDYGDIMVVKLLHSDTGTSVLACSSYQLKEKTPVIANLLHVKQSDLYEYFKQTNATFMINNVHKRESSKNGIVEVGFILDAQGNTSSFEIIKSSPQGNWHTQALNAAQQLKFSPSSKPLPMGMQVYTSWVFEFTAN